MSPDRRVIWDQTDQIDTSVRIFELGGFSTKVIVVYPGQDGGEASLAREVLIALGKDEASLPLKRGPLVEAAQRWLEAEQVEEIVIYGAQRLKGRDAALAKATARTWLVTSSYDEAIILADGQVPIEPVDNLFNEIQTPERWVSDDGEDPTAFPRIPYDEFFTFIPSSYGMYQEGDELDQILDCFHSAMQRTDLAVGKREDWSSLIIKDFIHRIMPESTCIRSAVCKLRAAQASLFRNWIYVRVNLLPLLATWRFDSLSGMEGQIAKNGRRLVDPITGLIATLAHLTNLTSHEVSEMNRDDVSDDGAEICFAGRTYLVPERLQAFVRCYLLVRESERGETRFLVTKGNHGPVKSGWAQGVATSADLGKAFGFVKTAPFSEHQPLFFNHLEVFHLERHVSPGEVLASL